LTGCQSVHLHLSVFVCRVRGKKKVLSFFQKSKLYKTSKNYKRQEESCQEETVPARPEKVLVEDSDQDEVWAEVQAWEPVEIVSAPNAAPKAPIPGECPAIP
jgi:hypothetical protein